MSQIRQQRAEQIPDSDITKLDDRYYIVKSQSRDINMYVDIEERSCSCEDHAKTGQDCKHILKIDIYRKERIEDIITEILISSIT